MTLFLGHIGDKVRRLSLIQQSKRVLEKFTIQASLTLL